MGGFQLAGPHNQDSKILRFILNRTIVGEILTKIIIPKLSTAPNYRNISFKNSGCTAACAPRLTRALPLSFSVHVAVVSVDACECGVVVVSLCLVVLVVVPVSVLVVCCCCVVAVCCCCVCCCLLLLCAVVALC